MRKLTIFCLSFSAAVFLCNYLFSTIVSLCILFICLSGGIFFLIKGRKQKNLLLAGIILVAFALGSVSYNTAVKLKKAPASDLDGRIVKANGKVLSFPENYDGYSSVDIIFKTDGYPSLNTVLYDSDGLIDDLKPGDIICFNASVRSADIRYGKDYDVYNAKDIFLKADIESDLQLTERHFVDLRVIASYISDYISERIRAIFPDEAYPFMKSLMLGDKSDFYDDDEHYVALSRAGMMHIVAVSGMHVAFVVTIIQLIFGSGKPSSIACIILIWCFVLVSGASPSAVRAGIMQTILLLAPLFRRENDPVTSLSFALAIILVFNPFSCASISLQLSFAAMAGLVLFAEKIRNAIMLHIPETALGSVLKFITDVFSASIAVMVFSLPLTAIHFGSVAILSPISNILALWSVSFCFGGGYLSVFISIFSITAGKALAFAVSILVKYIFLISSFISSFKYAVVYTEDTLVLLWLIFTCMLIFISLFSNVNTLGRVASVLAGSVLVLSVFLTATAEYYKRSPGFFTAVNVGQGQCICAFSEDKTVVIDCGTINYGLGSAGDKASAYLRSRGRDAVDYLILTHFHSDHVNGVVRLIESFPVKNIVVSESLDDEEGYYEAICTSAQKHSINIISVKEDSLLSCGRFRICLFAPDADSKQNESCMITLVSLADYDMIITGDAPKSIEREFIYKNPVKDVEMLIVGHHGSRYSSSGELLEILGGDTAVISVGYNTYGHPTGETLERLSAYGYSNIYRTDLNGTVEIPVGVG